MGGGSPRAGRGACGHAAVSVLVLGATGHIGRVVAERLLADGEGVVAVTRDAAHGEPLRSAGAELAVLDVTDVAALRAAMRRERRAFLLNPPADPAGDTDAAETATVAAMLAALDGSGLEGVVALSTYGATPEPEVGDLSVLHGLEQGLATQPIPAAVVRAAYLMSNWDMLVEPAEGGTLPAMFPADFRLPMVAPADVGAVAARLLTADQPATGLVHAEGPARYTPGDVAAAFERCLGREVRVATVPPDGFEAAFKGQGFSGAAATSFARMTRATLEGGWPEEVERGPTTLEAYVAELVGRAEAQSRSGAPSGK